MVMFECFVWIDVLLQLFEVLVSWIGNCDVLVMGLWLCVGIFVDDVQVIKFMGGMMGFLKGVIQLLWVWMINIVIQIYEFVLQLGDCYFVVVLIMYGMLMYMLLVFGVGGVLVFFDVVKLGVLFDIVSVYDVMLFFVLLMLIQVLVDEQCSVFWVLGVLCYLVYGGVLMWFEQICDVQVVFGLVVCMLFGQIEVL